MADLASELRHAFETLIQQQVDAQAVQRGWDEGAAAAMAGRSSTSAALDAEQGLTFATGYDGTITTTPFTFGISVFGGGDILI